MAAAIAIGAEPRGRQAFGILVGPRDWSKEANPPVCRLLQHMLLREVLCLVVRNSDSKTGIFDNPNKSKSLEHEMGDWTRESRGEEAAKHEGSETRDETELHHHHPEG
jgi:hypothetical protein